MWKLTLKDGMEVGMSQTRPWVWVAWAARELASPTSVVQCTSQKQSSFSKVEIGFPLNLLGSCVFSCLSPLLAFLVLHIQPSQTLSPVSPLLQSWQI